jgi:hypothetical protein
MADDDKDNNEGFDPWADLESDPAPSLDEGFSFSLEEAVEEPVAAPFTEAIEEAIEEAISQSPFEAVGDLDEFSAPAAAADDDLVTSWLDETADEAMAEQPLAVFSPDEPAETDSIDEDLNEDTVGAGLSSIEIGTGESGVHSPSSLDPFDAIADDASPEPVEAVETISFGFADEQSPEFESAVDAAEVLDFGSAAAGVAAGAAAASAIPSLKARAKAKPQKKKSGIGQMVGIVMGGAMAIPITLAILIWGFHKDPFKVTKHVPESVAFLLPQKFQRGGLKQVAGGPNLSTAPSLDDLPSADTSVVEPTPTEPAAPEEPTSEGAPVGDVAGGGEAPTAVELAAITPVVPDGLDDLLKEPAVVAPLEPQALPTPIVPEPEPLDLSGLEQAVADATIALDAVKAGGDPGDPVRKTRLVDWYKKLARVAQELAMLEHVAADSGRPLTATPDTVGEMHLAILAEPELIDDMARLSRNWLAYAKRGSDGVVMPATFAGSRQVGPYWSSRVSIAEADGGARELAIISRAEPAALPGDVILITGLVMNGDVVWASDLRSTTAGDANGAAAEPGRQPDDFDSLGLPAL